MAGGTGGMLDQLVVVLVRVQFVWAGRARSSHRLGWPAWAGLAAAILATWPDGAARVALPPRDRRATTGPRGRARLPCGKLEKMPVVFIPIRGSGDGVWGGPPPSDPDFLEQAGVLHFALGTLTTTLGTEMWPPYKW